MDNSKRNNISFFQHISLFNKSLTVQIIFLSISIISTFLALYYVYYQNSIEIFISEGVIPRNLNWMLFFIGGSAIILLSLLFMPIDESFFKKRDLIDKIPHVVKNIEAKFIEESFGEAISIIETYFDELYTIHVFKKNEKLLFLYKQAQINKKLKILLKKINDLLSVNALDDFNQEFQSALTLIENNNGYILESQKKKLEEISNRSRFNG